MIESNLSQACILTDSKDSIQSLPQILIYLWSKTTSYKHCQIILFPSLLLEVNYNPSWLCFIYSESSNLLDTKCHTECGHRNSFPFALLAEISVTLPHLQAAIDNLVILFWQLDFLFLLPVPCPLSRSPPPFFLATLHILGNYLTLILIKWIKESLSYFLLVMWGEGIIENMGH